MVEYWQQMKYLMVTNLMHIKCNSLNLYMRNMYLIVINLMHIII